MGLLDLLSPRKPYDAAGPAASLYVAAVAQARMPTFYTVLGVPDTLDGRFDLIVLHVHLLCRRLAREGEAGAAIAQALFDTMFKDMDRNLREMGVGDPSVPRRIRAMVEAYYGRVKAYEESLAADGAGLAEAIARNVFGKPPQPGEAPPAGAVALAAYVRAAATSLDAAPFAGAAALSGGRCAFPPPAARG